MTTQIDDLSLSAIGQHSARRDGGLARCLQWKRMRDFPTRPKNGRIRSLSFTSKINTQGLNLPTFRAVLIQQKLCILSISRLKIEIVLGRVL